MADIEFPHHPLAIQRRETPLTASPPLTTKSASRFPHSVQRCRVALLVRWSYQTMNGGGEFARTHRLHQDLVPIRNLGRQLEHIAAHSAGSCG
jgi:hypothetical protein